MSESEKSTFYVLDLDRTLFDTIAAAEMMRGVVALHDPALASALEQRFEELERLGESFSMREFIVERAGEEEMQAIAAKYIEYAAQQDLLLPGARELLEYVASRSDAGHGILTYGSEAGQSLKIQAVPELAEVPFLVTGETYKGELIASWRGEDDLYHIPIELGGIATASVVLIDDKPFSFKGLPIDCRGYLASSKYDAGLEKLPSYVVPVKTLHDVMAAEKRLA